MIYVRTFTLSKYLPKLYYVLPASTCSSVQYKFREGGKKHILSVLYRTQPRPKIDGTINNRTEKKKIHKQEQATSSKRENGIDVENHVRQFKNIYLSSLFCLRLNLVIKLFKTLKKLFTFLLLYYCFPLPPSKKSLTRSKI